MLSSIGREFPVTKVLQEDKPSKEKTITVTEAQVQEMIDDAIRQHNRNAGLISMVLGFVFLALFAEGFFRMIGFIPPFMGIDINIVGEIADKVKEQILPLIQ
jgi:hypothetical protein|tara:strand:- start:2132 stop:2437 length:306 start_codon:yes stop_codon:yes gene_type:complete